MEFLKDIFSILDRRQKLSFLGLQLLIIFTVFFEVTGISLILPFTSMIGDPSIIRGDNLIAFIYDFLGFEDYKKFIVFSGVSVLFFLFCGAFVGILTTYKISMFASSIGVNMGSKLYKHYLQQDWSFHLQNNSSDLVKKIATECQRLIDTVLIPLMQLNSRIFLAFSILVLLFIINPIVASLGFGLFSFFYLFIFSIVRKIVFRNGHIVSSKFAERYKTMLEGFGGIKDLLILRRQQFFYERFESSGNELSQKIGTNKALETSPRYLVEFLAFSAVIVLILYLSSVYSNELSRMLPIISIYAVAALKLLPALQGIYGGLTSISGNMAAFYSIKNDLYLAAKENPPVINLKNNIKLKSEITFNNISYRYPHQSDYVLKNFSLSFPANKLIGIVGPTGSGKSTIVDLVLGLLVPESGSILIDNQKINSSNIHAWQKKVGYVPQSSFLADLSIAENIAFGIKPELIDMQRVSKCAQISMIHDYIFNLPDKYDSMIGEKGVQMSGGQRQRISIARALYNDPEFLVLDEATSALDGITEKQLMESIIALSKNKTILMIAHKLNTVKNCDKVLFLQDGILSDQGTYDEMLEQNSEFKNFVNAVWKIK